MREMANAVTDDVSVNYGEYYYEKYDKFNPDLVRDMLRQAAEDKDAKDAEVERLREIVEGLLKASTVECASCDYDCGQNRENCIIREAEKYIKEGEIKQ